MPPRLVPVDGNPFEATLPAPSSPRLVPVEGNPFAVTTADDIRAAVEARARRRDSYRRIEDAGVGRPTGIDTLDDAARAAQGETVTRPPPARTAVRDLADAPPVAPPLTGPGAVRTLPAETARIRRRDWERGQSSQGRLIEALTPPPPPAAAPVGIWESLHRGERALDTTADLVPYYIERGLRHVFGDDPIDATNQFTHDTIGTSGLSSEQQLVHDVQNLNAMPRDPTLVRAGQAYERSPGVMSGLGNFLGEVVRNPSSIPNLLAEQAPSLALGYGMGRVATTAATPLIESLALRAAPAAAERVAQLGATSVFGASMNATMTGLNAGQNVAGRYEDPNLLVPADSSRIAAASREGLTQTAGQLPASTLAGALLPVRTPLGGYAGAAADTATQAIIQGAGGAGSVLGGNEAIGQPTSGAELATAAGTSALLAPIDMIARARAAHQARIEATAAEFDAFARAQAEQRAADGRTGDDFASWSEAPARHENGEWRETGDGIIAGHDGSPTVFRDSREAARFMVDNELGGDYEREFANGGIILRRRVRTPAPEAPAAARQTEPEAQPGQAQEPTSQAITPTSGAELATAAESPAPALPAPPTAAVAAGAATEPPAAAPAPQAASQATSVSQIPTDQPASNNRLPDPGPLEDGEHYVSTAQGDKIRTIFHVVDASSLQHATGDLQNRDRTRAASDAQVQDIIGSFDPARLGNSPEADRGAPIVGPDGVIESGNGRVMALNKIYDAYPEQAAAYRSFLEAHGLDDPNADMPRPILIRLRTSPLDDSQRRQFIVDANRAATMELTPTERARSDADFLDSNMLGLYRGGDIGAAGNRDFVRSFQSRLPASEQGALIDSSGALSQAGIKRLENALMARAYEHSAILEKLMEARDNNIRSIGAAMLDNAGAWGSLRAEVAAGHIQPQYDVTDQLVEAARIVSDVRSSGAKIGDHLAQQGMFGEINPVTEHFIRAFYNAKLTQPASRGAIGDIINAYARQAAEQTTTPRLIEAEPPTPEAILRDLLERRGTSGTGDMFAAPDETQIAAEDRAEPSPGRDTRIAAERGGRVGPVAARQPDASTPKVRLRRGTSHAAIATATEAALAEPTDEKLDYSEGRSVALDKPSAYDPEFMERSFTNRESIYDTAAVAAGHDPARFRLLPGPQQIKILATVIKDVFGVTVEVAKGMQDRFAIDQLLDAFQNMQGMAHILGLPLKAISLGGRLVLHLQKTARFLGAYQPSTAKIMLPGRSNSFSHEWGHGFDYYLLDIVGDGLGRGLSGAIRARGERMETGDLDPSRNVREAFIDYLNAMFFDDAALAARLLDLEKKVAATKAEGQRARLQAQIDNIHGGSSQARSGRTLFYRNAKAMDGPGEEGVNTYWSSPTELLARSFEAYVSYRAELQGFTTEFIGKGDAEYLSNADERFAKTFPKDEERERIFAALDVLFDRVAAEEMLGAGPGADRPLAITATRADLFHPPEAPKGGIFGRLLGVELGAWQDFMIRRAKAAADRPNNPKGKLQMVQDVASFFTYGMTSRWKMLARRYKSPTLLRLHDLLTYNTGSGRFTARGLIHATRLRENQYINRIDRALERNGFPRKGDVRKELTIEEGRILRDLLISEKVPGAPANLVNMAAEMRRLEDEIFYDLQRVGIDVGYTRNGHLQRMVDVPKVLNDQAGFVDKAGEVYERVFDRDYGEAEDILSDDEALVKFLKLARRLAKQGHDTDPKAAIKLIRQIQRLGDEMGGDDPDQTQAKVDRLSAELAEMFGELHGATRSAFAEQSANDWLLRILSASPDEFDKRGPDNGFTKKRRLPPEADKILEDFYINDPVEVMATYSHAAARRIEYAARFGQDSSKLGAMFDQMAAEGVASEDIEAVRDMLNIVTGRQAQRLPPNVAAFGSAIHLIWGTIALLPRATFSSLAESLTAGIVMENPVYGIKALASLIEGALGTADARERREIARFIGLIEAQGGSNVLANRFGGTYGDATRWDRIAAKMFYKTGLVALTRAQHTHIIAPAHAFLDALAGRIIRGLDGGKGSNGEPDTASRTHKDMVDAIARYKELGIRDPEAFAREIRASGRLPSIDELSAAMEGRNPYAFDWITAIDRLKDQVIQNPSAIDKPRAANSAIGRLFYGIQTFNYGFWRNIIKGSATRFYERAKRSGYAYSAEKLVFGLLPSVAALLLAQTVVSTVREYLTNRRRWEQRKADGTLGGDMAWLGLTRTFGTPVDPLVQGFTGLKYERDLTAVPLGPAIGNIAQNLQAMAMPLVSNSAKTNTAEYNALRGFYRLGIGPLAGTALSAAPGGPVTSSLFGFGTGYVTAPTAGDEFAAMFVGEKARRRRGRARPQADALFPEAAAPRGRQRDALFPNDAPISSTETANAP